MKIERREGFKKMTYQEVVAFCSTLIEERELDHANLHNKLGEPERQSNESLADYRRRLKLKQFVIGYGENDYIIT